MFKSKAEPELPVITVDIVSKEWIVHWSQFRRLASQPRYDGHLDSPIGMNVLVVHCPAIPPHAKLLQQQDTRVSFLRVCVGKDEAGDT